MESIRIVKLGGNIISDDEKLMATLQSFAAIQGEKILIHGGGNAATSLAKRMDIPVVMQEGRRITDDAMLEIVTMVYGGLLNKKVTAILQSLGVNAIGMSGADGNIMLSDRRKATHIDYGNVGDVKEVNTQNIKALLHNDFIPVICALTHDGKGNILNTNADTIASVMSSALAKEYQVELIYCFELNGVLKDFKDKQSVISYIDNFLFEEMKMKGSINDGMIPKVFNALSANKAGVQKVYICHYTTLDDPAKGTQICYQ